MAIVGHFMFTTLPVTTESLSEQKKTQLLMVIIYPKLHTLFKTSNSKFAASNWIYTKYVIDGDKKQYPGSARTSRHT